MWTMSHIYEIKLLYFLLLAAAILQNWADGHENHFLIYSHCLFVNLCWILSEDKQKLFEDVVMVKKPCLFKNGMDFIVLSVMLA